MKLNTLLKNYVNERKHYDREIGRYWATDLYGIVAGRTKPEDFLKRRKIDLVGCRNIIEGEIRERAIKDILGANEIKYQPQTKKVLKFKNFVLVVKADFVFPDYLLETKAPKYIDTKIKTYHYPQLEAQYRAFKKPIYIMYLKERFEYKSFLYIPDDKLWKLIQKKLKEFHENIRVLNNK